MNIFIIKTKYPENKGFKLYRENIGNMFIFIHFFTPANAILKGKATEIKPGGCVFFSPNMPQTISSPKCNLIHDWFHADVTCENLMKRYNIECETLYYPSDSENVSNIMAKIEHEHIYRNKFYKESISACLENLFIELARGDTKMPSVSYADKEQREFFSHVRSEIHADLKKQWTVKQMAELANLSESRFYYIYKKLFGISPQQDLIKKRIHTAQTLLTYESISVKECSELVGYTNLYHFIRQFKQISGTTPGKIKILK